MKWLQADLSRLVIIQCVVSWAYTFFYKYFQIKFSGTNFTYTHTHIYIYIHIYGSGSSVGIATDYGLDVPGSNLGGDEIFRSSRPALAPTQPPVKWVPGLSRG